MEQNSELALAWQFIENTGTHLFLTGKAGTGKTTFLRRLKQESPKRMVVLTPTGIAAINAGGVTIHSFFQIPFATLCARKFVQYECYLPFPFRQRENQYNTQHGLAGDR